MFSPRVRIDLRAVVSVTLRVLCVAAALTFTAPSTQVTAAPAQTAAAAPRQQFEVASVKPCETPRPVPGARGGGGPDFGSSPGTLHITCFPVPMMIDFAYIQFGAKRPAGDPLDAWDAFSGARYNGTATGPLRVRGGPSWAASDRFSIEAKADGAATRATMMGPMLRALLEDRFKLKIHQETEEAPMWALTVAATGLKIKPMKDGECATDQSKPGRLPSDVVGTSAKPTCGLLNGEPHGPNWRGEQVGLELSALASLLAADIGAKVIDRTGTTEKFTLTLEYAPDDRTPVALDWMQRHAAGAGSPTAENLFTALEKQLGLKLERIKGLRGYLMIDHVERPSPDSPLSLLRSPH